MTPVDAHVPSEYGSFFTRNAFDENVGNVMICISSYKALCERESAVMLATTTTIPEFELREYRLIVLLQMISITTKMLCFSPIHSQSGKGKKDHFDIPAKGYSCLRCFFPRSHYSSIPFELLSGSLNASFENNNSYNSWFIQNFKSSSRNKPKTWTEAKATLECRFDPVDCLGLIKINFMLHSMRMYTTEQLAQYMDRFDACVHDAKVQMTLSSSPFAFSRRSLPRNFKTRSKNVLVQYIHQQQSLGPLENTLKEVQTKFASSKVSSSSSVGSSSSFSASVSSSGSSSGSSSRDAVRKRFNSL
ncbi:uncharacterized protein EV154DRAFT_571107 [Mucor mucedo]|uniref:uncharacterized protein n=1 Tax=Mucor mucedo TaxID=29922 RepID=UPI002220BFCD|nr:uncharacterized protein EV154DRAFT_571107 [Mucor mucedo]KAI7869627.1 hypothetical protein EV154DRAFT_571107 [Mucor mucedo]